MHTRTHQTWQAHAEKRGRARLARVLRRTAIVLSLLALSAFLVYLLFPPFFAPKTHLVLIGSKSGESFNAPAIPFVGEDLAALGAIQEAQVHDRSDVLKSAASARRLSTAIADSGVGGSDNLIVYLSAHGVAEDSKAFLICDNFDLRKPDAGRVSVERLIGEVSRSNAATKLVVINAGSIDYDPRLGIVGNEFPRLLEQAVHQANDPTLWVYCSHSPLEYSHVSRAARRSVFGMFFGAGLGGAADLDRDQKLTLAELVGFTSRNVANWVTQSTDRNASQTPRLFWGGGKSASPDPQLLALFQPDTEPSLTVASLIGSDDEAIAGGTIASGQGRVQGVLRRHQVTLASNKISAPAKNEAASSAGQPAGQPGQPAGEDQADSADNVSGDATPTEGNGNAAGTKDDAEEKEKSSAEAARSAALLADAWKLRDQIATKWSPLASQPGPTENKPHLWREFQAELLSFEQQIRGGSAFDAEVTAEILKNLVPSKPPSGPVAETKTPQASIESFFAERSNSASLDAAANALGKGESLALAQIGAAISGQVIDINVDGLETTLQHETRQAFDEWFKTKWRARDGKYLELAYLKRLSDAEGLDWKWIQLTGKVCLLGERVAAYDLLAPNWIRSDIDRADQYRFFAEELVFDKVGLQWERRLGQLLETANGLYQAAEADFAAVRHTSRTFERVLDRLPAYLRWNRLAGRSADARGSIAGELSNLLDRMSELSRLLSQPGKTEVSHLVVIRNEVDTLSSNIESLCGDAAAEKLLGRSPAAGDTYRASLLLSTPLLTWQARSDLYSVLESLDRQLASNYQFAKVGADDATIKSVTRDGNQISQGHWNKLVQQAELESRFVALAGIGDELDGSGRDAIQAVQLAFEDLRDAYHQLSQALSTDEESSQATESPTAALWRAHGDFGVALRRFYLQAIEASGEAFLSSSRAPQSVRMLRMIDGRDAWQLANVDVDTISLQARVQSTIAWQQSRQRQAALYRGIDPVEVGANDNSGNNVSDVDSTSVAQVFIQGPDSLDLQYADSDEIEIEVLNRGDAATSVTLSMDFEQKLLEVKANGAADRLEIEPTAGLRFLNGRSQFGTRRSGTIDLAAGESRRIPIKVSRQGNASQSTKLVVDVFDASDLLPSVNSAPKLIQRKTLNILLPVSEVFVRQGEAEFVSDTGGLELLPHPNRLEAFRFGLVSHGGGSKQISMKCYSLGAAVRPSKDLHLPSVLATAQLLTQFDLSVPGGGSPVFPVAEQEADEPGSGEQSADGEAADKADEPAKAEAAEPIQSTDMPHGMLVVMTDVETGQSTLRLVDFAVQRPRRFVRPRVGYDAGKNQIKIAVSARDVSALPSGEPIQVTCELADDASGRTKGKLQGEITKDNPTANLFLSVSMPPPHLARVYINVDGYPRAFIFDVSCGKQQTDIPEVTGLVDLRMATSSTRGVLPATDSIPIALQLDAPVGSFETGMDELRLGIDLDQSGNMSPDNSVRVTTDRSVNVGFVKSAPNGEIQLHTTVSDHSIELPASRLENLFIDVAAVLTINNQARTFPSIPLLIDTAPPVVGPVNRVDGLDFVAINSQLELTVWAWDEGSDVKKIEAAFDEEGTGEFPKAGPVFYGTRSSDRQWTTTIESGAEPGKKSLLVRGIDAVGNASEPVAIDVEVVSAGENVKRIKQQTVDLIGTILLREKGIAQTEIRLLTIPEAAAEGTPPAEPEVAAEVRSQENGHYRIPAVEPGTYRIAARGVVRNRVHRTEKEVNVTIGPQREMRVDVVLP